MVYASADIKLKVADKCALLHTAINGTKLPRSVAYCNQQVWSQPHRPSDKGIAITQSVRPFTIDIVLVCGVKFGHTIEIDLSL